MNKLYYKAGWYLLSCFLFFIACSTPRQKMLNQKWHLTAIAVSHNAEDDPLNYDSTTQSKNAPAGMATDTVQTAGSTDFFDFSDGKKYTAQLMGITTKGTFTYNEVSQRIIRHNETTNITDTIEIKKLSKDTLVLYEKENMLTMILSTRK